MYGYRHDDVVVTLPAIEVSDIIIDNREVNTSKQNTSPNRKPVSTCLPGYVYGLADPKPDIAYNEFLKRGISYRLGRPIPNPTIPNFEARLTAFVERFFAEQIHEFCEFDEELNFEEWLEETSYPEWRKNELRAIWDSIIDLENPDNFKVKVFGKDEFYFDAYKFMRAINARKDHAKCIFGPMTKKWEKIIYKHPAFVKKVPVSERPKYINDMLKEAGATYMTIDWTSFEGHCRPVIFRALEYAIYKMLIGNCQFQKYITELFERVVSGVNHIENFYFYCRMLARRMSGEMTTSLGNGLINLIMTLFVFEVNGIADPKGGVEGDDGVWRFINQRLPTVEMFREAGCLVKLDFFENIEDAGFCGNIFADGVFDVITNPYKQLAHFGWADVKYFNSRPSKKKALSRAKALSMLFQYPGCPVLAPFAKKVLDLTRGVDVRGVLDSFDSYHRHIIEDALKANLKELYAHQIDTRSRICMEENFGLPVDVQILIEKDIESMTLNGFFSDTLLLFSPRWQEHFWSHYVEENGQPVVFTP